MSDADARALHRMRVEGAREPDASQPTLDWARVVHAFADAVVAARGERIFYANPAAERLLGWTEGTLRDVPLVTIVPERLRAAHLSGLARYRSTRVPRLIGRPVRVPALRRDGTEVDIELTLSDLGGDVFIAVLRDLRERVELERQLSIVSQLQRVAVTAARIFGQLDLPSIARTAVDTLLEVFGAAFARVWTVDDTGRTLVLQASGGLSSDVEGSSRRRIDLDSYRYKVGRVARSREPFVCNDLRGDPEFDQDWVAREDLRAMTAYPLQTAGQLHGVLVAFFRTHLPDDTTTAIGAFASVIGSALNDLKLLDRLREAVAARDEFLSLASHELKTPITTLKLQIDALARDPGDTRNPTRVARAQKQLGRLAELVDDLLDVSRLSVGVRLNLQELDLAELVKDIVERHHPDIVSSRSTVTTHLESVRGVWDRRRIDQVVTNLLGNALKYGRGEPIEVHVLRRGDVAVVEVRDRGAGIAAADHERIFRRFERATGERAYAGLGLGLYIAREIAVAHRGSLTVQSELGQGATFVLELPLPA